MARGYQSPVSTGMAGRCPRCGEGALFDGFLKFAPRCEACGADFTIEDTGDGPAFFVMSIVLFIIVPLALAFHMITQSPTWLTMVIWIPILIVCSLALLRPMRGVMFNTQWIREAREVRSKDFTDKTFKS